MRGANTLIEASLVFYIRIFCMSQNIARNHHYLSQFYLKGFTDGRSKKSKLSVIDLQERTTFLTKPRNVGAIRDFNRLNVEGIAPDELEVKLSAFEGQVATAIKHIEATREFEGEDRNLVLNLIALIAIRNPAMRENVQNMHKQIAERIMDQLLASEDIFNSQIEQMRQDGYDVDRMDYESLKKFHEGKRYTLTVSREWHIALEFSGVNHILSLLDSRGWLLLFRNDDAGPFITSDHPVVLFWNHPESIPPLFQHSPGYGMKDTTVYFPLSQDCALVGLFDRTDAVIDVDDDYVCNLNTAILHHSQRQIYAPKLSFQFLGKDGSYCTGKDLLKILSGEGGNTAVIT